MSGFAHVRYPRFAAEPLTEREAAKSANEKFETLLAQARGRARADGFEEGVAHAEARFDAELRDRIDAIASAIADAECRSRAVEERVAGEVRALIAAFAAAIAPRLGEIGAADAAAACISDAMARAPAARPLLEIGSNGLDEVRLALRNNGLLCEVKANDDLPEGVARIAWSGGFDEIDIRPAIEAATDALSAGALRRPHGKKPKEPRE